MLRRVARSPYVHPALFAAYPVILLWANNLAEHPPLRQVLIAMAMMVGLGALVFVGLFLLTRDVARSAIATSIFIVLFGAFGRIEDWLQVPPGSILERALLVATILLLGSIVVLVKRAPASIERTTPALNAVALALVLLNAGPFLEGIPLTSSGDSTATWSLSTNGMSPTAVGPARDVYYLIFDRYAGPRTLRDLYGFDDTAFVGALREDGFDVIDDALANYPQTTHSLASSLNMTYLDRLADDIGTDSGDWGPLRSSLSATTTSRTFQSLGYRYEHIGSWWDPTAKDPSADVNWVFGGVPEFTQAFRDVTGWGAVVSELRLGPDYYRQQYERIPYQVDALHQIARDPGLTFTFAHFTLPHPPYVFHADGTYVPPDPSRPNEQAYIDQLQYANTVIESIAKDLVSSPGPAPIVVIQSDEGPHPPQFDSTTEIFRQPWSEASDLELGRKLRILNAYYLPGDVHQPSPTITPVNTFRVILDDYFGADLPLLPDRTYIFTDYQHPYRFEDVTDRLRGG